MAASQSYLKWGLCPQTPGIFIEGINVTRVTFLLCPKGDISKLLQQSLLFLFTNLLLSCTIVVQFHYQVYSMSESKQDKTLSFDITHSSGETHPMNVTEDYVNDMRRFLTFKDATSLALTNKRNFNFYKPLLAGRQGAELALTYIGQGRMDLLYKLIEKHPFLLFEKYPEIKAPRGQIYFDLSPFQFMAFYCDTGLMTCADGKNIKILSLIPKEFNEIRQAQYDEMNCGGADLIKMDKNPKELLDFNEVLQFKETYTILGNQQEVSFSLLENTDGIIRYQANFYYVNKNTQKIEPLKICLNSDDEEAFAKFQTSFEGMPDNSSRRSSDDEHRLIRRVLQCTLVRKGIRYEDNGIRYRDSQASFNNLINAYRICISLCAKAVQGNNNQALWDKADAYWRHHVGTAQAKSPIWILQRYCEKKPFYPAPENFDNFIRELTFDNWVSPKDNSVLVGGLIVAGLGSDFALFKGVWGGAVGGLGGRGGRGRGIARGFSCRLPAC